MKTKCTKHPKYKGKRKPNYDCVECLELYLIMQKPRVLPKPTKKHKDKSKYDRKRYKEILDE